jgi:hypothetical protein
MKCYFIFYFLFSIVALLLIIKKKALIGYMFVKNCPNYWKLVKELTKNLKLCQNLIISSKHLAIMFF